MYQKLQRCVSDGGIGNSDSAGQSSGNSDFTGCEEIRDVSVAMDSVFRSACGNIRYSNSDQQVNTDGRTGTAGRGCDETLRCSLHSKD